MQQKYPSVLLLLIGLIFFYQLPVQSQSTTKQLEELKQINSPSAYAKKAIKIGIEYLRKNEITKSDIFFDAAEEKVRKQSKSAAQSIRLEILDESVNCCIQMASIRKLMLGKIEEIIKDDKKKVLGGKLKNIFESINQSSSDPTQLATLYRLVENYTDDQDYLRWLKANNGANLARSQLESEKKAIAKSLNQAEREKQNLSTTLKLNEEQLQSLESASDSMNTLISLRDQQLRELKFERQIDSFEQAHQELLISQKEEIIDIKDASNRRMMYAIIGTIIALILMALSLLKSIQINKQLNEEKAHSEELLLNILPANIAEEIKANGKVNTREYENSTVLFSDFLGFSQIAKKVSAAELVDDLNTCFTAFDKMAEKYGVEKIKTIGDAYMCIGGIPEPHENSALNVVKMGIEMQSFLEQWNQEREIEGKPALHARIGIHTGKVAAGVVGFNKFCYDVWGDTVNVASRMESNGIVNKVNLSETTARLLQDQYQFHSRGEIEIKNMGAVRMYYII